jgi:hypothetical protein
MEANVKRGTATIVLDRPRKLVFNFNALALIEETLGISLQTTPNPFTLGARGLRAILYAGLKKDDPTVTVEQVGEFFDEFDREYIGRVVSETYIAAIGGGSEETKNGPSPTGTGDQS